MPKIGNAVISDVEGDFIPLARDKATGSRLFRKQVLPLGSFAHPQDPKTKITVTPEMCQQIVSNFDSGVCDIVQVPLVDDANKHSEDPTRNIGRVTDVEFVPSKGLYATLRADKHAEDIGTTLLGASAFLHLNYLHGNSGEKVGPTLLHLAVTNRPHITNLEPFEAVLASASDADTTGELTTLALSAASEEDADPMTLEELMALLKTEHGIDVEALQASATAAEDESSKAEELKDALVQVLASAGVVQTDDSDKEISIREVAEGVVELGKEKIALSSRIETLESERNDLKQKSVEAEVDALVKETRILPAQRDAMVELALSNHEMFERVVPDKGLVSLSANGFDIIEPPVSETLKADIERLAKMANHED